MRNNKHNRLAIANHIKDVYDEAKMRDPNGAANLYSKVSTILDDLEYNHRIPGNVLNVCDDLERLRAL